MSKQEQHIEFLEQLTEESLPDFFCELSEDDTQNIHAWVSCVLEKERSGLDQFFGSMTQTFKYIPNFLIISITNKYVEPPIAARITEKLTIKQAVSIAIGLSPEYVGETAVYIESKFAAQLLAALPKRQAKKIVEFMFEIYPLRVLDVFAHAEEKLFNLAKPPDKFINRDRSTLSELRCGVLERFL